ncbi:MAG: hypothetical protein KJO31_05100 [Gammaproteobacteria bacterium]|nr:hypothetical protein [Gammaproteobacteria bacterium]
MREKPFRGLRSRLLAIGVAPRTVGRTLLELQDHLDDLQAEAIERGHAPEEALRHARRSIGDIDTIVAAMRERHELRSWHYRFPRVARLALPLAYVALLPVAPLFTGVSYAATIMRWTASLMLAAAVTATMFLLLQLSIVFS